MYICTMYNVQSTKYNLSTEICTKYNLSSVDRGLNHCLFEKVELINKFAN